MFTVSISSAAQRDLKRLAKTISRDQLARIDAKIRALADDPFPAGHEKLTNDGGYRVREGDYRILYDADVASKVLTIRRVLDRKDAYRH